MPTPKDKELEDIFGDDEKEDVLEIGISVREGLRGVFVDEEDEEIEDLIENL